MAGKRFSQIKTLVGVVMLLLLPFVFLKVQKKAPELSDAVGGTFLDLSSILQEGVLWAFGGVSDALERRFVRQKSEDEIFELRAERTKMRTLEIMLTESERENARLKELLAFSPTINAPRVIGALVIGQTGIPLTRVIQIDRGSKAGVKKGDAVVNTAGAVGQVLLTGKYNSEVLLLPDASSAIDVVVERSRIKGIMRGLKVHNFDRLGDVRVGDILVTSGVGARFPEGMPIGKISRVKSHEQGLYTEAEVEPFVNFNKLEEVLVLTQNSKTSLWRRKDMVSQFLQVSVAK